MFQIFIMGASPRSERAVENLRELCVATLAEPAEVQVVDVLATPEQADEHKIIATPTVVRLSPVPVRRVIGDLADFDAAAEALGLPKASPE